MEPIRLDLLPPEWPVALVALLAAGLCAAWWAIRAGTARLRGRLPALCVILPRVLAAVAAAWGVLQLAARWVTYACPWPLWLGATLMGGGVECVLAALRRSERPLGMRGKVLMALRSAAVVLVALMLMQPMLVFFSNRKISRRVAVLVDASGSMRFTDRQWTPPQYLAWRGWQQGRAVDIPTNAVGAARAWEAVSASDRTATEAFCATSRLALADALIQGPSGILPVLRKRYDVDMFTFARRLRHVSEASSEPSSAFAEESFVSATDLTGALEQLLKEEPSEQLAGVLLLSDGLHNVDTSVLPVARRLAAQGVPVSSVSVGGARQPLDVSVADVLAPESVFLGDKVRVTAAVRATGAAGKQLDVSLLADGVPVDTQRVDVATDDWVREVRLSHEPRTNGVAHLEVRVSALAGELFSDNNAWRADVAVSDDRINVLLVDDRPRWEFRYLRNLFYGRDKSVNLQFWLVHPDTVSGSAAPALPHASAARKFGDAEAGGWPDGRDAWRAFDVIIIGDVAPGTLTQDVQAEIRSCVADRGALLVVIGGPEAMPSAYSADSPMATLLPFALRPDAGQTGEKYRLVLTPAGQSNPVMAQSASLSENEEIWKSLEPFEWRLPVTAKPGAEVLAMAIGEGDEQEKGLTDVREAAAHLEDVMSYRARHALIAAWRVGRGKVLGLASDQTWRLRYKIGDVRHHRFWGQVLRWGLGERLRDGDERFRVGTDKLVYGPDDSVRVVARLLKEDFSGEDGARLEVAIRDANGHELQHATLAPRPESHGIYEALLPPPEIPATCRVIVSRQDSASGESVETSFLVTASRRPIEMGRVRPDSASLLALAKGTGGKLVTPDRIGELAEAFGEGSGTVRERHEYALWCHPLLLAVLGVLLTAEWLLRKKHGLS
jgi:hypothetical protein